MDPIRNVKAALVEQGYEVTDFHQDPVEETRELSEAHHAIVAILRPFYNVARHCIRREENKRMRIFIKGCLGVFLDYDFHDEEERIFYSVNPLIDLVKYWYDGIESDKQFQIREYSSLIGDSDQTISDLYFSLRGPALPPQPS